MANQAQEKGSNGFGMDDDKIRKLVKRQQRWEAKNQRNKVAAKLMKAKILAADLVVSEDEIDAAIAAELAQGSE